MSPKSIWAYCTQWSTVWEWIHSIGGTIACVFLALVTRRQAILYISGRQSSKSRNQLNKNVQRNGIIAQRCGILEKNQKCSICAQRINKVGACQDTIRTPYTTQLFSIEKGYSTTYQFVSVCNINYFYFRIYQMKVRVCLHAPYQTISD